MSDTFHSNESNETQESCNIQFLYSQVPWFDAEIVKAANQDPALRDILDNVLVINLDFRHNEKISPEEIYKQVTTFLSANPDNVVVFTSWNYAESPHQSIPNIVSYLHMQHVTYVRLSFTPQDLAEAVKSSRASLPKNNDQSQSAEAKVRRDIQARTLSTLRHDLGHALRDNATIDQPRYDRLIAQARTEFDIAPKATDKSVEEFIINTKLDIKDVFRGEIPGVYCDIDDTLIHADGTRNDETIKLLTEYEAQGHKVHIWTGGAIIEARQKLEKIGVTQYPLLSKLNYAGATAEIVIDNVSSDKFYFQTHITAKKFIRV